MSWSDKLFRVMWHRAFCKVSTISAGVYLQTDYMPFRNAATSRFPSERCWKVRKSKQKEFLPSSSLMYHFLHHHFYWSLSLSQQKSAKILKCIFSFFWRALFIIRWFFAIKPDFLQTLFPQVHPHCLSMFSFFCSLWLVSSGNQSSDVFCQVIGVEWIVLKSCEELSES